MNHNHNYRISLDYIKVPLVSCQRC